MQFARRLRQGVCNGDISCSVRIWQRPRVKPGGRYRLGDGHIEVDSVEAIELQDITRKLARASGFDGVADLLKTAKHGRGDNVYLVRFHYVRPRPTTTTTTRATTRAMTRAMTRAAPPKPNKRPTRTRARASRMRLARLLERLPEATAVESGDHLSLEVRKKRFGYFLDNHHGDGRLALNCKSSPDVREALEQLAPAHYHIPKYLGSKGWVGVWLDTPQVDWSVVELALREAYVLTAPKSLARP